MEQHIYKSSKGEFLSYHDWVAQNGTSEEQALYDAELTEANSDAKKALYIKWAKAEQIISHVCIEDDGFEREFPPPADA